MAQPSLEPVPEPLRLPRGSVRGFLSLALLVTFGVLIVRAGTAAPVPAVFVNSVVVVLAFYFGSKGPLTTSHPPPSPGSPAPAPPRLVRLLLLVGFGGLALWFLQGNLSIAALPPELLQIWEVLAGYVVGIAVAWYFHRHVHESPRARRIATVFRDVSAAGVLGLTVVICAAYLTNQTGYLAGRAEEILSVVITYYFGARVIA